ncbi:unnamed protein product [Linum tenue]|uniref:Uncharacterized protein n=1 Tax=Linum tenue TaxID=586396 RepID=A0AAV0LVH5_9ROSI|nr:unnamed protein product [Linum tenue]
MCYWNGRMANGPNGIHYEGATPKPTRVGCEITYEELLDKIYMITGFDKLQFALKIICRYPACREFIPVPIEDNESIDIVFDVARQPDTNCLELYVEKVPITTDDQANASAEALLQVNDEVGVFSEDNQLLSDDAMAIEVDEQALVGALDCSYGVASVETNENGLQPVDNHRGESRASKGTAGRSRDVKKQVSKQNLFFIMFYGFQ